MEDRIKTGAVCCSCGGMIELDEIRSFLESEPDIAFLGEYRTLCAPGELEDLKDRVAGEGCRRLVLCGCSFARTENRLKAALSEAGLDQYGLSQADIRRDPSPETAARACARLREMDRVEPEVYPVRERALVLGGGLAAMHSALRLAESGYPVTLVSSEELPAGEPQVFGPVAYGECPEEEAAGLVDRIAGNDRIQVLAPAEIRGFSGQVGNFSAVVDSGEIEEIRAGVVVAATGCRSSEPAQDYGLEPGAEVTTLTEFEEKLSDLREDDAPGNEGYRIAFLLNREDEESRLPFFAALKAALLAAQSIKSEIYLVAPSIKVAGEGYEELYRRIRELGVVVFKTESEPEVQENPVPRTFSEERFYPLNLVVRGERLDGGTGAAGSSEDSEYRLGCDLLVLNRRLVPGASTLKTGELLGLEGGPQGFLQKDNVHLAPVLSERRGIFLVGGCRGPVTYDEMRSDVENAVEAADELLEAGKLRIDGNTAEVDTEKCAFCLTCLRSCPHGAVELDYEQNAASIARQACQSCGICASECPAEAIQLAAYSDGQFLAQIVTLGGWEDVR